MRRVLLTLVAAVLAVSTVACGGTDVTVMAQLQGTETDAMETGQVALSSLPVRLLPFDRDAIFDSLEQAYPEPEPEIPDSILALQDRVIEAQQLWREAETQWIEARDSLQALADTLSAMDQGAADYFVLFQEFGDLEEEVLQLEEASSEYFQEFTTIQARLSTQSREISLARQNWADEAFARVDSIFEARQEELGREVRYDTTSAQGVARFTGVPEGDWWVNARFDRQFDELYWNVAVEVTGEELEVRLTDENAEARQKM